MSANGGELVIFLASKERIRFESVKVEYKAESISRKYLEWKRALWVRYSKLKLFRAEVTNRVHYAIGKYMSGILIDLVSRDK